MPNVIFSLWLLSALFKMKSRMKTKCLQMGGGELFKRKNIQMWCTNTGPSQYNNLEDDESEGIHWGSEQQNGSDKDNSNS